MCQLSFLKMNQDHQHFLNIFPQQPKVFQLNRKTPYYSSFKRHSNNPDKLTLPFFSILFLTSVISLHYMSVKKIVSRRKIRIYWIIVLKNSCYFQETHFSFGDTALNLIHLTEKKKPANLFPIWYLSNPLTHHKAQEYHG